MGLTWEECRDLLIHKGTGKAMERRKLNYSCWVEIDSRPRDPAQLPGEQNYRLKMHNTYILTFRPDGGVEYDNGGWQTITTAQRMNEFGPVYIWSDRRVWYWESRHGSGGVSTRIYRNGMTVYPKGTVMLVEGDGGIDPRPAMKLKRECMEYGRHFMMLLEDLPLAILDPDAAWRVHSKGRESGWAIPFLKDCHYCTLIEENRLHEDWGGLDILTHMQDRQMVPAILPHALGMTMWELGRQARGMKKVRKEAGKALGEWLFELIHKKEEE